MSNTGVAMKEPEKTYHGTYYFLTNDQKARTQTITMEYEGQTVVLKDAGEWIWEAKDRRIAELEAQLAQRDAGDSKVVETAKPQKPCPYVVTQEHRDKADEWWLVVMPENRERAAKTMFVARSASLARIAELEAQLEALRETTLVEAVNEIRNVAAACDSDLLHGMCHASNVVNRMTARYQTPLLKEEK
jgi:hypothetical protein